MGKRHETIGIKQAIRFEWMQKTASLLLAGLDAKTISWTEKAMVPKVNEAIRPGHLSSTI